MGTQKTLTSHTVLNYRLHTSERITILSLLHCMGSRTCPRYRVVVRWFLQQQLRYGLIHGVHICFSPSAWSEPAKYDENRFRISNANSSKHIQTSRPRISRPQKPCCSLQTYLFELEDPTASLLVLVAT
jgi:hypothetical protein